MRANHPAGSGAAHLTTASAGTRRSGLLVAYRWMLLLFLLAGATQIFLAGLGVFSVKDQGDSAFSPHRTLGFTMAGIAMVILILAALARPGARAIILAAVLVVLTSLMQSLLAGLGDDHAIYGALHALDGLLIIGIAVYLYARARRPLA
jgi:hypothetical protein